MGSNDVSMGRPKAVFTDLVANNVVHFGALPLLRLHLSRFFSDFLVLNIYFFNCEVFE